MTALEHKVLKSLNEVLNGIWTVNYVQLRLTNDRENLNVNRIAFMYDKGLSCEYIFINDELYSTVGNTVIRLNEAVQRAYDSVINFKTKEIKK